MTDIEYIMADMEDILADDTLESSDKVEREMEMIRLKKIEIELKK